MTHKRDTRGRPPRRGGETDVSLEWSALQVCAAVILAFQVSALVTLGRVREAATSERAARQGKRGTGRGTVRA